MFTYTKQIQSVTSDHFVPFFFSEEENRISVPFHLERDSENIQVCSENRLESVRERNLWLIVCVFSEIERNR